MTCCNFLIHFSVVIVVVHLLFALFMRCHLFCSVATACFFTCKVCIFQHIFFPFVLYFQSSLQLHLPKWTTRNIISNFHFPMGITQSTKQQYIFDVVSFSHSLSFSFAFSHSYFHSFHIFLSFTPQSPLLSIPKKTYNKCMMYGKKHPTTPAV